MLLDNASSPRHKYSTGVSLSLYAGINKNIDPAKLSHSPLQIPFFIMTSLTDQIQTQGRPKVIVLIEHRTPHAEGNRLIRQYPPQCQRDGKLSPPRQFRPARHPSPGRIRACSRGAR